MTDERRAQIGRALIVCGIALGMVSLGWVLLTRHGESARMTLVRIGVIPLVFGLMVECGVGMTKPSGSDDTK